MFDFDIKFTRYGNGRRENSAPMPMQAADFADAVRMARAMLAGMRSADRSNEYEISAVCQRGLAGETHTGPGIWESGVQA